MIDPDTEHNNATFAYEYTQKTLEKVNKSLDNIATKLIATLAFSGVILKFAETLSDAGWLIWLKVCVCIFSSLSIISCGLGLTPYSAGKVVDPESFLDPEIYRLTDEECKVFTMRQALKGITELDDLLAMRRGHLNVAITMIVFSGIFIAISIATQGFLDRGN